MDYTKSSGRNLPLAGAQLVPVTVNLHLLRECNYSCAHCFAGFPDVGRRLVREDALHLVRRLASARPIFGRYAITKLTFAGGEPTLHPDLPELVATAHELGLTTCVVTNGSRLARRARLVEQLAPNLDWLAVSLDGSDEETNELHGRGRGDALALARDAIASMRAERPAIKLKINTVVTALNWSSSMLDLIADLEPDRWKLLQVTHLEGENDAAYPRLAVTRAQFEAFVTRHSAAFAEAGFLVAEREDLVQGTYLMVDPAGRLFGNDSGCKRLGPSLLGHSLEDGARLVGWNPDGFIERGGSYEWQVPR